VAPQREWFEKDYYKTLGVSPTATPKEITSAYRKLAKQHHPDTNPGHEETFKEISAAYDVLGDAPSRKEYDEVRTMGPVAGSGFPGGFGGPGANGGFRVEDMGDLGDLFGGLFGRGRRGGGTTGPQRGSDVEAELHLSFEDAVSGVTTSVNVTTDARCHTTDDLSPVQRGRHPPGQSGPVLPEPDLPPVRRARDHRDHTLSHLQRLGCRAPEPLGQGPHPGRGGGRTAHPGQGPRRGRAGQRPER